MVKRLSLTIVIWYDIFTFLYDSEVGCNPELRVIDVINQNIFKVNTADLTLEDMGTTPGMIFGGIAVDSELGLMFYATGSVIYYVNIDGTDTQQLIDLSSGMLCGKSVENENDKILIWKKRGTHF